MIFRKSKNPSLSNALLWCLAYFFLYEIRYTAAIHTIETRTIQSLPAKGNVIHHSVKVYEPDKNYSSDQIYSWNRAGITNNDDNKEEDLTRETTSQKTLIVKRGETQKEEDGVATKDNDSQTNEINSSTTHASDTNKDHTGTSSSTEFTTAPESTAAYNEDTTMRQSETTRVQVTTSPNTATATATTNTPSDSERITSKGHVTPDSSTTSSYHESISTHKNSITFTSTEYTFTAQETTSTQLQTKTSTSTKYESIISTTGSSESMYTTTPTSSFQSATTDYYKSSITTYTPSETTEYTTSLATTATSYFSSSQQSPTTEGYTSTTSSSEITSATTQDSITETVSSTEFSSITSVTMTADQQTESSSSFESYTTFTLSSSDIFAESTPIPQPVASSSFSLVDNAETISAFDMSQTSMLISTVSTPTLAVSNELPTLFSNANSMFPGSETRSTDFPTSTRSFSVTSSTATPLLVLGSKECTGDIHAVYGKCPKEYFCNAAKKTCVLLLADGEQCFEDFQCESTYCVTGRCGGEEKKTSSDGGKIAGVVVGSVAGASLIIFALIRWRKRSRIIGRRMNQFQEKQRFYDATTTIVPEARLSKYNFLQQMLEPPQQEQPAYFSQIPAAASKRVHNRPPMEMNYVAWGKEDEETLHRKTYQYF